MNKILEEDIISLIEEKNISWDTLKNSTFLITGSTGLIGSVMVKSLIYRRKKYKENINLVLIVRNVSKAKKIFGEEPIEYIESSLEDLKEIPYDIDYVIHAASPTKSKFFVTNPVETMDTSIIGTKKILEICKNKKIKKFVYLSSMEMYGVLNKDGVDETDLGYINNLDVRSCYSEGKRVSELYAFTYFKEYNVPTVIARLAMCFGAGISKEETRVYKYFCDCVLNKEDIHIKSTGKTVINFVYVMDALKGIFILLTKGIDGNAYNIVADSDHFTVMDMAKYLVEKHGDGIKVIQEVPSSSNGFAPDNTMTLSNQKIKELGFKQKYNIKEALDRTLEYLHYE